MPKNVIVSIGPSEDQIAAQSVPIPQHVTLAATNTEPVRTKGQPASVHEVRQPQAKGDNALDQFSTRLSPVSRADCRRLQ